MRFVFRHYFSISHIFLSLVSWKKYWLHFEFLELSVLRNPHFANTFSVSRNLLRMQQTIEIQKQIDNYLSIVQNILNQNTYQNQSPENYLFLKILERFSINLDSTNILLSEVETKTYREFSIKLILRTNLLDFIIINFLGNLISKIKSPTDYENDIKYQESLDKILCEQASYDFKNLKLLLSKGIITREEYEAKINIIFKVFKIYISEVNIDYQYPERNLKYNKFLSVVEMFKQFSENNLTKKFANVYELYHKFSKYEHVGLLTHHYQIENKNLILNDILFAIKFCIKGTLICTHLINHSDENINNLIEIEENLDTINYS